MGFGAGYYLGAKAGRTRYEELNRYLQRFRRTSVGQIVDTAASKTKEVVGTTAERARDTIEQVDPDEVADKVVPDATTTTVGTSTTVGTTGSVTTVTTNGPVEAAADLPPYTRPL